MVLSSCYVLSVKWVLERMRIIMMIDRLHDVLSHPIGKEVGEYYSLSETKNHFLTGIKSKNDGWEPSREPTALLILQSVLRYDL